MYVTICEDLQPLVLHGNCSPWPKLMLCSLLFVFISKLYFLSHDGCSRWFGVLTPLMCYW